MKKILLISLVLVSINALAQFGQKTISGTNQNWSLHRSDMNDNYTILFDRTDGVVTPQQFGAVGDGVTSDRSAFVNAVAYCETNDKNLFIPAGSYYVPHTLTNSITLSSGICIYGDGANRTFLITDNSSTIFYAIGETNIKISGISFTGSGKNDTQTNQIAINLVNSDLYNITECTFEGFANAAVQISSTITFEGGVISKCRFYSNNIGVNSSTDGEYVSVLDCHIHENNIGFTCSSGNNLIDGCKIISNDIGVEFKKGSNDSHSSITSNLINHNTTYGIKVDSIQIGLVFVGNQIFSNNIILHRSKGVVFTGNDLGSTVRFAGSLATTFSSNTFYLGTTFVNDYLTETSYTSFNGNVDSYNSDKINAVFEVISSTDSDTAFIIRNKSGTIVFGVLDNGTQF